MAKRHFDFSTFTIILIMLYQGNNASYIGETTCHLTPRIKEHLENCSKSHIFKHLDKNRNCRELCDNECFETINSTTSSYRLKLNEKMHITWEKLSLDKQAKHVSFSITIQFPIVFFHLIYYCYCFLNHVALILFKIIFNLLM